MSSQFHGIDNMLISGGVFVNQNTGSSSEHGFKLLQQQVAAAAMHDSGEAFEKPICHENTRFAVLNRAMNWLLGNVEPEKLIMWLYGDAGAGKSAIAQTLALRCAASKRLLASFFFSRNDAKRDTHIPFVPTISYQIATTIPDLRHPIVAAVERDPVVFKKNLELQFASLILDPINTLTRRPGIVLDSLPNLIIIDGLDECSDPRTQHTLLDVIANAIPQCNVRLKVLIASRPEVEISNAFNAPPLSTASSRLALDNVVENNRDIRLFLESTFQSIKAHHPLKHLLDGSWPGVDVIRQLVKASSGQFIYASTVGNYVSALRHYPKERLEIVLGLRGCLMDSDLPFVELDALYIHILGSISAQDVGVMLDILAFLAFPVESAISHADRPDDTADLIFTLFSLERSQGELLLRELTSILKIHTTVSGQMHRIRLAHASLGDFLSDPRRSKQFHVDRRAFWEKVACICFAYLKSHPTSVAPVMHYALDHLLTLCDMLDLTPDLRQSIRGFSFLSIWEWFQSHTFDFVVFSVSFMTMLRDKPNASDLYAYHLRDFDRCILMLLDSYRPPRGGLSQAVFLGLIECDPYDVLLRWIPSTLNCALFSPAQWKGRTNPRTDVLLSFFDDPSRSGEFARSGITYANAALIILEKLCDETWCQNFKEVMTTGGTPADYVQGDHFRLFTVACFYLPQLLERSSPLLELVDFIRSGGFDQRYGNIEFGNLVANAFGSPSSELIRDVCLAGETYLRVSNQGCTAMSPLNEGLVAEHTLDIEMEKSPWPYLAHLPPCSCSTMASTQGIMPGGIYVFTNSKAEGTALTLDVDNKFVIGFPRHGGSNQQWELSQVQNGWVIRSVASGGCLGFKRNQSPQLIARSQGDAYVWHIWGDKVDTLGFRISAPNTGMDVDLASYGSAHPGTPVSVWGRWHGMNQVWHLEKVS